MKRISEPISKIIVVVLIAGAFVASVYLNTNQLKQHNRMQEITSCAQLGYVEYTTPEGAKVHLPDDTWYQKCLKDKEIK